MPVGLDGNPDLAVTVERTSVLNVTTQAILDRLVDDRPLLVAVDGIDGSGKSTFADEVAAALRSDGRAAVRSTIDSFHNPQETRWTRGPRSPVGFYYDSHDLAAVQDQLLRPLASGTGSYVTAVFDEPTDQPVSSPAVPVQCDVILIFDGIFALRPELAGYWDLTVFLDAQQRVNLRRLGYVLDELPSDPIDVVTHVLEWNRKIDRYASGMQYYLDLVDPMSKADIVIDNNDLAHPRIVTKPMAPTP